MRYCSDVLKGSFALQTVCAESFCVPHRAPLSTPSRCWKRATRQTSQRKETLWAAGTLDPWRMALCSTPIFPQVTTQPRFEIKTLVIKMSQMFLQERERKSKRSLWVSKSAWAESFGEWVDIWGKFRGTLGSRPRWLWLGFQWDEALLTMSKGETARLEIDPEWAYGKKGLPDSKYPFPGLHFNACSSCWCSWFILYSSSTRIPPNAKLFFEVELVAVD